jgi:hypothetical protein
MSNSERFGLVFGFGIWLWVLYLAPQLLLYVIGVTVAVIFFRRAMHLGTLSGSLKSGVVCGIIATILGSYVGISAFGTAVAGSAIFGIIGFIAGFMGFHFFRGTE